MPVWPFLLILSLLGACSTLPGQGPGAVDIALTDPAADVPRNFAVVDLSPAVIQSIGAVPRISIGHVFGNGGRRPGVRNIGVGDKLVVRIWETSPDGVFATAETKSTEFPVVVSDSGTIYIPYAGELSVLGLAIDDIRARIARALEGKAVDPEVTVVLQENNVHTVSVVGDASRPGQFSIAPSGMRLLDSVALAGGTTRPSFDMEISLLREGRTATARLDDVLGHAGNNVWLMPRDTVRLIYRPRSFTAFGAVTARKQYVFETETVSLAEALGQVGGLSENLADKGGVFVFRFETRDRARKVGATTSSTAYRQGVPVVYRLDFSTPEAFFLAQSFMLQDKDVVYVALASVAELNKFVRLVVSPFLAVGQSASAISE
jgi:polysaccharide export outer membrane protein